MKINELLHEWLEKYAKDRIKPRTYRRYQGLINLHISPALGEIEMESISSKQIQEFLSEKKKDGNIRTGDKLSATSINLMLTVLNMAFEYAVDMESTGYNPCVKLKRSPENSRKIEAFSKDEQRKLESVIKRENDRRLFGIILCLYTGLRIGELLALEWEDIDLANGIIAVEKTIYREKDDNDEWKLHVDSPKTMSSERVTPPSVRCGGA